MSEAGRLLLPPGSRLVHIGPHKTGTTAIQQVFHQRREQIAQHGVHYAGAAPQAYRPALALTGRPGQRGAADIASDAWDNLVSEVARYGEDRVLISSESFSNAEAASIAKLRQDLGPDRLRVVMMARRYDALLPSLWQQRVVGGYDKPWEQYAERILATPGNPFWRHFGIATLPQRWAEVIGPERVTVVVVNEQDHDWLPQLMASMLGLPSETLLRVERGSVPVNRSLTWAEADMLRRVNQEFNTRPWSDAALRHYIRHGIKAALKSFPSDRSEGRPRVAAEDLPRLEELTRRHWDELQALGVRVVGKVDWLLPASQPIAESPAGRQVAVPKVVASVTAIVARSSSPGAPLLSVGEKRDDQPTVNEWAGTSASATKQRRSVPALLAVQPGAASLVAALSAAGLTVKGKRRLLRQRRQALILVPPWQELLLAIQDELLSGGVVDIDDLLESIQKRDEGDIQGVAPDVVVVAPLDRPAAVASFLADLLGESVPHDLGFGTSRPLTSDEMMLLSQTNTACAWNAADRQRYVLDGMIRWLRTTQPHPATSFPPGLVSWAKAQAGTWRTWIESRDPLVVGDLAWLGPPLGAAPRLSTDIAGAIIAGAISQLP